MSVGIQIGRRDSGWYLVVYTRTIPEAFDPAMLDVNVVTGMPVAR